MLYVLLPIPITKYKMIHNSCTVTLNNDWKNNLVHAILFFYELEMYSREMNIYSEILRYMYHIIYVMKWIYDQFSKLEHVQWRLLHCCTVDETFGLTVLEHVLFVTFLWWKERKLSALYSGGYIGSYKKDDLPLFQSKTIKHIEKH